MKPSLRPDLEEAFYAFYWLSERRDIAIGMSSAIGLPIPITEIKAYYEVFKPYLSLPHFTRIISAADREYLKQTAPSKKAKVK